MAEPFRLVAWNIRAGGGHRASRIAAALIDLSPDAVVLSEFRSTPPSQLIATDLVAAGLIHQQSTCGEVPLGKNALLIAAGEPLKRVALHRRPAEPGRWRMVRLQRSGLAVGGMHIPNQHTGRKPGYHDAVAALAERWRGGPGLLVGDTNSGRIGADEETPVFNKRTDGWFGRMARAGWIDGFRHLHPDQCEYTWYSHRGNGFRLDQVFLNRALTPYLRSVEHRWLGRSDQRRDELSDHAALIVDFAPLSTPIGAMTGTP
ncbi:MAG: endonuclease/exonuclease/phosphatase family protein [Pseudomonadota bacterium]